jgi:hypothetical protein
MPDVQPASGSCTAITSSPPTPRPARRAARPSDPVRSGHFAAPERFIKECKPADSDGGYWNRTVRQ